MILLILKLYSSENCCYHTLQNFDSLERFKAEQDKKIFVFFLNVQSKKGIN